MRALVTSALLALAACAPSIEASRASGSRDAWGLPGFVDDRGVEASVIPPGERALVTMIYTSCALRCPRTIETLRGLERALAERGEAARVVLITLDPERDTPERLRAWRRAHELPSSWRVLRGARGATLALARSLGVHAAYDDAHIDHDVVFALFDARGHLVRSLRGSRADVIEATASAPSLEL